MDMDRDEKHQASAPNVEKKSKLPAEQRNKKRGRLSTLIRERAEKKKALSTVMSAEEDKSSQIPNSVVASSASKNLLPLSPNDNRFNFSRLILDALNTGDIDVFEETLRRLCSPEVISTHLYTGSLEHSPLGPNSRVIIGYDAIMSVWRDWFKIAPDSVFLLQNPTAFVDKKTNNVTSSIHYTSLFTRVLEGKPKVDQESVEKMENFKNNLFNAPVNSATGIATTIIPRVKPVSTGPVNRGNSFKFVNTALQQQQQTMTANTPAQGQIMYNNNNDINNDHNTYSNTYSNTHSSSILKTLSNDGSAEENEDIDTLIDSLLEYDSNVIGVSASEQQDAYNTQQYQQFQDHHQQQQQQQPQQQSHQYMYDHQLLAQQQYELHAQQLQQQQQQQQFYYDNTINNSYGSGGVNGYFEQPPVPAVFFASATAAVAAGSASIVSPARDAQQVNPVPLMTKSQAIVKDESFFSQSILHGTKNSGSGSSNSSNSNSNINITSSNSNSESSINNNSSSNDVVNNSNAASENATSGQTTKKSGTAQPVVTIVPPKRDLPGAVVKEIIRYTYDGTFSVNVNPQKIITKMNFSFSINVEESSVSSGGSGGGGGGSAK